MWVPLLRCPLLWCPLLCCGFAFGQTPDVPARPAALLLGMDQSPGVLPALLDALTDSDWSVRAAAVHAVALRNDIALMADLSPLLDDKKEAVRDRAAAGYLRLEAIQSRPRRFGTEASAEAVMAHQPAAA